MQNITKNMFLTLMSNKIIEILSFYISKQLAVLLISGILLLI